MGTICSTAGIQFGEPIFQDGLGVVKIKLEREIEFHVAIAAHHQLTPLGPFATKKLAKFLAISNQAGKGKKIFEIFIIQSRTFRPAGCKIDLLSKFKVKSTFQGCSVNHWRKQPRSRPSLASVAAECTATSLNLSAPTTRSWFHPSTRSASWSRTNWSQTVRRFTWRLPVTIAAARSLAQPVRPALHHLAHQSHALANGDRTPRCRQQKRTKKNGQLWSNVLQKI